MVGMSKAEGTFIVVALGLAAVVFGTLSAAEGVQDRLKGGGAPGGQVPVKPPGPAERGVQLHGPIPEAAVLVLVAVGLGGPAALVHLGSERAEVVEVGPASLSATWRIARTSIRLQVMSRIFQGNLCHDLWAFDHIQATRDC
jgi:hypothetical protein